MEAIKIRGALKKVSWSDCFDKYDRPLVNKFFLFRDPVTNTFREYYTITGTSNYDIRELKIAFMLGLLHKLEPISYNSEFCFKLILVLATKFDFFECDYEHKNNIIYYIKSGDSITGPYISGSFDETEKFHKGLKENCIYIPSKKQTFEQIELSKAS